MVIDDLHWLFVDHNYYSNIAASRGARHTSASVLLRTALEVSGAMTNVDASQPHYAQPSELAKHAGDDRFGSETGDNIIVLPYRPLGTLCYCRR
jgi:hypothetical protein